MSNILFALATVLLAADPQAADWPACGTVESFPTRTWTEVQPQALGWNAPALKDARAYYDSLDSAAVMVVHRGHLVAEWGDADERYDLASLRKSVLSALYGVFVGRNAIDLDATLAELHVDDREPSLSRHEKQATVRDLLMARSGVFHSAHYEMGSWKREKQELREWSLEQFGRPSAPPGRVWLYNNWDFNTAATILEQVTGEPLGPAFDRLLAKPLGMQDFRPKDVSYVGNESYAERRMGNLSEHPAFMFTMSTRDLARLGTLYLNCGRWDGQQLIPRDWVLESTAGRPVSEGAPDGRVIYELIGDYGYMWWVDRPGSRRFGKLNTREPVYYGTGYRGHYLWVAPYLDLVVVHQVATTGGVGTWGQIKRRIFGSDEISGEQFQELLRRIILAHPDGAGALEPEAG